MGEEDMQYSSHLLCTLSDERDEGKWERRTKDICLSSIFLSRKKLMIKNHTLKKTMLDSDRNET